jgi:hypothetical protein
MVLTLAEESLLLVNKTMATEISLTKMFLLI